MYVCSALYPISIAIPLTLTRLLLLLLPLIQLYYELNKMYKTPMVRTTLGVIGHTQTELFKDFDVGPVGRFIAPPMPIDYVADKLIEPLEAQESKMVIIPSASITSPGVKGLPYFVRDFIQWSLGADGSYPSRPTQAQLGN